MLKIAIVEDSVLIRKITAEMLETAGFQVIIQAKNGKDFVDKLNATKVKPDIIVLDYEMPIMNGYEVLKYMHTNYPDIPVVMFSSITLEGAEVTLKCLDAGAVDFVPKPDKSFLSVRKAKDILIEKLKAVASVSGQKYRAFTQKVDIQKRDQKPKSLVKPLHSIKVIAMGSSTGGVKTAGLIIKALPKDIPPMVWAQHMPPMFTKSLAKRLDVSSKITVREARNGDFLVKGTCLIAPGGKHMRLVKRGPGVAVEIFEDSSYLYTPSCDVLFESVANVVGRDAIGIILTGMGDDGAKGLKRMRNLGAYIIGQDKETSIVYGMPKAAYEIGAVDIQLPDIYIAGHVTKILN